MHIVRKLLNSALKICKKIQKGKSMIWIILSVIIAGLLFYYKFVRPFDYWQRHGVKQTKPLPFFGDNLRVLTRVDTYIEYLERIYNLHPETRYTGVYEFSRPVLLIKDPELIKQVVIKDFDHFTDHQSFIDPAADPLWEKNLFALKGRPWREMRATLSGSFTSSKMKQMFGLMKDASDNFVQYFLKKNEKVIEVEMRDTFTRFANDVIATTAFGVQVDSLTHRNNEFYLMGKEVTEIHGFWKFIKVYIYVFFPTLTKGLKVTFFNEQARDFFRDLIHDLIKTREKNGIVRPDMINLLMEVRKGTATQDEKGVIDSGFAVAQESPATGTSSKSKKAVITDDDIVAQALIFFFAGFNTVSSVLCFLSYELALNPDIQCRLREEIKRASTECNGDLTYEVLLKMKYLDMVLSEVLRKWPSFTNIDRVCTKPYTIEPASSDEKPIHLKVGDEIWIPSVAIQRDPQFYPNPEKFDPERFSDENKNSVNPYTYLPFGVGPRNCIASRFGLLEIKAVFFSILLNFEIVPIAKSEIPIKIKKSSFNLAAANELWFGLKRTNV